MHFLNDDYPTIQEIDDIWLEEFRAYLLDVDKRTKKPRSSVLLEHTSKMLWVFESKLVSNFTYRLIWIEDLRFRGIDKFEMNVFVRGLPGFFFNEISEVIRRKVKFIGTVSN